MNARGKIQYRDRARQLRDFSGLRFERGITPSDIDGVVEFDGRCFVFIEYKMRGASMPIGQKILLERVCDSIHTHERTCAVIVAEHAHPTHEDINAGAADVVQYRWNGVWHEPIRPIQVRAAIEKIKVMPNPKLPF